MQPVHLRQRSTEIDWLSPKMAASKCLLVLVCYVQLFKRIVTAPTNKTTELCNPDYLLGEFEKTVKAEVPGVKQFGDIPIYPDTFKRVVTAPTNKTTEMSI